MDEDHNTGAMSMARDTVLLSEEVYSQWKRAQWSRESGMDHRVKRSRAASQEERQLSSMRRGMEE